MKEPFFTFVRGSTPVLRFTLGICLDAAAVVYATFFQGDSTVLEYQVNGAPGTSAPTGSMALAGNGRELWITMTQADTLAFRSGEAAVQFRVKTTAGADASLPCRGWVAPVQKGDTI